jgi:NAD(P)-dependent dehydrogenase (short-subunit alcohol dehydrogenase family)
MDGKRVLITGASRGIGRAIAEQVLSAGGIVGVNYLSAVSAAEEVAGRYPGRAILLQADVRDPEAVGGMVDRFIRETGGIDVLVNNAGFAAPKLLLRKALADLRRELDTNLLGPILVTRAALPQMLRQRAGLVAFITSTSTDQPRPGLTGYGPSKGGVEVFARTLALEYRSRGIRALCLRLGPVRTEMFSDTQTDAEATQLQARMLGGRMPTPEEVAPLITVLLSDAAELADGCIITLDAGFSLG